MGEMPARTSRDGSSSPWTTIAYALIVAAVVAIAMPTATSSHHPRPRPPKQDCGAAAERPCGPRRPPADRPATVPVAGTAAARTPDAGTEEADDPAADVPGWVAVAVMLVASGVGLLWAGVWLRDARRAGRTLVLSRPAAARRARPS
jgi:hypothetical protein